jgi:hypothetical protein
MMKSKPQEIIKNLIEVGLNQGALFAYEEMRDLITAASAYEPIARELTTKDILKFVEKSINELTELTAKAGSPADIISRLMGE